ncbi:uncharacterized protein [Takifugu rubripes]|uniref:uncharacterized protein n=1 Tax=Takifugu rubripes TaxID=31033 RepID=UPI001145874E|nr:uncharacterized protein LOC115252619 [Takifugu rubripes]
MNDVFMFVDMLKLMLHIDATQRVTSHRLLEHQFITMSHIMPFYNLSPYSRSCHEIMMVSQIHSSRDAEWQSSQQVNISSAQPKYDVCPSPLLHPAVMTGQAQLAGHDWDTTVHSKKGSKSKAGDCNSIYEPKLKPSGGSPARETHAGPLMSTSIKPHPEARSHMRIRSVHPSGDPQPQVLCWNTNISQGKRPPFEHTSNDGSSKQLFVKRKTCDDHEIGRRDAKNPKLQHQ